MQFLTSGLLLVVVGRRLQWLGVTRLWLLPLAAWLILIDAFSPVISLTLPRAIMTHRWDSLLSAQPPAFALMPVALLLFAGVYFRQAMSRDMVRLAAWILAWSAALVSLADLATFGLGPLGLLAIPLVLVAAPLHLSFVHAVDLPGLRPLENSLSLLSLDHIPLVVPLFCLALLVLLVSGRTQRDAPNLA
jgi:hypothetical protein